MHCNILYFAFKSNLLVLLSLIKLWVMKTWTFIWNEINRYNFHGSSSVVSISNTDCRMEKSVLEYANVQGSGDSSLCVLVCIAFNVSERVSSLQTGVYWILSPCYVSSVGFVWLYLFSSCFWYSGFTKCHIEIIFFLLQMQLQRRLFWNPLCQVARKYSK